MAERQDDYGLFKKLRNERITSKETDPGRFVSMDKRDDESCLTEKIINNMERGKYITSWRGVCLCTDPFDLVIYQSLIWDIRPATIIEIGAFEGGTALWFADLIKSYGLSSRVFSFDIDLNLLHPVARGSDGITFLQGDCHQIEKTFTPEMLQKLPHPWVIIEDAHVNIDNVLEHFYTYMTSGDYLVVEDLNPSGGDTLEGPLSDDGAKAGRWGPWKLTQVQAFVQRHLSDLLVDTYYNDRFGHNATMNMNGYLRRM